MAEFARNVYRAHAALTRHNSALKDEVGLIANEKQIPRSTLRYRFGMTK